jgi:hypothetical protein
MNKSKLRRTTIVIGLTVCISLLIVIRCMAVPCFTQCQGANWLTDCTMEPQVCQNPECLKIKYPPSYYEGACCSGSDSERGCKVGLVEGVWSKMAFGGPCYTSYSVGVKNCDQRVTRCNCEIAEDALWFDFQTTASLCWDTSCFQG